MIRDTFEILGDVVYAFCLFWHYMLILVWSLLIAALPSTAFAGGSCYSCQHAYVQHEVAYTPQTIIEHQNIFYSVGADVRQYAVAPQAIAQAEAGQIKREIGRLQDKLADYQQMPQYAPQQAQMQAVCYVPVQAQAAYCPPGTVPAAAPQAQPQQPQQPTAQPATPPQTFSDRAPQSIIQAACIKCHGGASVKGDLDFTKDLTCEQKQKALVKVSMGEMPKGGPHLNAEQFMQLAKELAALKSAGGQPEPAPANN